MQTLLETALKWVTFVIYDAASKGISTNIAEHCGQVVSTSASV
jgi:hypothetical protein